MARILIAWELGGAYGHFARCLSLANNLVKCGHEVVLVLQNIHLPWSTEVSDRLIILPAPMTSHKSVDKSPPINFSDLLRYGGFASSQDLAARIRTWQGIFSLARPDIVVSDFAPTAVLSARLSAIKFLFIGSGFAIPPNIYPWPSIRPWDTISDQALFKTEEELNRITQEAQHNLGFHETVTIRELYRDYYVLDTFVELDHYEQRNADKYIGPITSPPDTYKMCWAENSGKKILAYLTQDSADFMSIMKALQEIDAEVICVSPGLSTAMASQLTTDRMRISLDPIDLPSLLDDTHLVVNYGSADFSTQALLKGIPLMLRPKYVESVLLSRRIHKMRAGIQLPQRASQDVILRVLQDLLYEPRYKYSAQSFQQRYIGFTHESAFDYFLEIIEKILDE